MPSRCVRWDFNLSFSLITDRGVRILWDVKKISSDYEIRTTIKFHQQICRKFLFWIVRKQSNFVSVHGTIFPWFEENCKKKSKTVMSRKILMIIKPWPKTPVSCLVDQKTGFYFTKMLRTVKIWWIVDPRGGQILRFLRNQQNHDFVFVAGMS